MRPGPAYGITPTRRSDPGGTQTRDCHRSAASSRGKRNSLCERLSWWLSSPRRPSRKSTRSPESFTGHELTYHAGAPIGDLLLDVCPHGRPTILSRSIHRLPSEDAALPEVVDVVLPLYLAAGPSPAGLRPPAERPGQGVPSVPLGDGGRGGRCRNSGIPAGPVRSTDRARVGTSLPVRGGSSFYPASSFRRSVAAGPRQTLPPVGDRKS